VHQPWHAEHAGAGGRFQKIRLCFEKLQEFGPPKGYFLEPSKSILVAQDHNKKSEACLKDFGFKVVTGSCCLGGFIGERLSSANGSRKSPNVGLMLACSNHPR
jgi:hypothetical protein